MTATKEDWKKAKAEVDAAQAWLAQIEARIGNSLGSCVACGDPIFEGEKYHQGADEIQCERCAPTYREMLAEAQFFVNFTTGEPMTPEQAKDICDAHVAKGGSLDDKMVSA